MTFGMVKQQRGRPANQKLGAPRRCYLCKRVFMVPHFGNRCRPCNSRYRADRWRSLRLEALRAYSHGDFIECRCCQERDIRLLVIDHVFSNGAEDRRKNGKGEGWLMKLKREGWPNKDQYQILCVTCNHLKQTHGDGVDCPHFLEDLRLAE